jgi:hypothetical protein
MARSLSERRKIGPRPHPLIEACAPERSEEFEAVLLTSISPVMLMAGELRPSIPTKKDPRRDHDHRPIASGVPLATEHPQGRQQPDSAGPQRHPHIPPENYDQNRPGRRAAVDLGLLAAALTGPICGLVSFAAGRLRPSEQREGLITAYRI